MLKIGCHLSVSKGFLQMGKDALKIGANTMQFFTRNPRGSKAKDIDPADISAFLAFCNENGISHFLAHAPYTLNPCSANPETRVFAKETMEDDLRRLELLGGCMYNFHPGSHTGQGVETGIEQISDMLNSILTKEQSTVVLLETMAGKGSEVGKSFEEISTIIKKIHLQPAGYGNILAHLIDIRRELRLLRADRRVNIDDLVALGFQHTDNVPEELCALGILVLFIGIGKMLADISERRRAEKRVHDRMEQNIRVGMS